MPDSDIVSTGGGQGFPADNPDGTPGLIGPDDYTRELRVKRATARPQAALAGNFADLQRLGAQAAETNSDTAFATPPGADANDKNVVSGIKAEANQGIWNRETERYGLVEAPPAVDPPENKSPRVIDPGSTSPKAEAKASTTVPTKK